MLIISMAISDLMMTIFNIPFNFYRLFNYSWPFGYWICFLINFIQHLTVYNSTYTMTIIALQRYRSVNHFQITSSSSSSTTNQFILQQQQQQQQQKRNNSNNEINSNTNYNLNYNKNLSSYLLIIIIIWLISGLFAWLLTYSSEIVRKKDASYHLLEVLLRDFYEKNSSSTTFDDNFNDTTGDQQQQEKFFENFLINQQQPNYQINRCRNSINLNLKQFIQKYFHIKPYLLKTIFVFITQYFIPLTLIGFLYIRIGKIIYQQGKLCNVQEQQQQQSANNSLLSTSESTTTTTTTTMMKLYSNDIIKQLQDQIKLMSNDTYRQERIYYATQQQSMFDQTTLKRCRNPINKNVQQFLLENFSIKPDLFITVTVFVTQYFIPLAIVGYIYIKIGKIIQRQGKLYDNRGNAKARIRQRKKLRRILMLILMVAAFAICWLPLHLFHLLTDAGFLHYNYRIFMMY
ncbi:hypothetical protein DERP_007899 [Dermatophagoides pteronyssinus]|uniref:G-protein coupled receptors family 1 profile domain-containing protein n=1 Tax=Dermatophagoides pteronyssinus TaxID=6956 RepID=A0ABQ8ISX2_DERPT|nr:hypothetical protein DERP_007899 [Dermatophagoides pteronyssinus]